MQCEIKLYFIYFIDVLCFRPEERGLSNSMKVKTFLIFNTHLPSAVNALELCDIDF